MSISISPMSAADGDEFITACLASRALHHPWIDPPDTHERFAAYLDHVARDDQSAFVIRHDECGALVGYVVVGNIVLRAFQSAYLAYGAFVGHERRGLMTIGVRAVIDHAFGQFGLHRLEANIQPDNAASIALARRLGFENEGFSRNFLRVDGEWRDHERWAIRSEIWTPSEH